MLGSKSTRIKYKKDIQDLTSRKCRKAEHTLHPGLFTQQSKANKTQEKKFLKKKFTPGVAQLPAGQASS